MKLNIDFKKNEISCKHMHVTDRVLAATTTVPLKLESLNVETTTDVEGKVTVMVGPLLVPCLS